MSTPPPPPPPSPPPNTDSSTTSLARLIRTTLTYDTNVMLAAIISLLLVILFVLLLHLYTRWFLLQARRRSHSSVTVPRVLGSRLHQRFTIIDTTNSDHSSGKLGLPISIISSLPLFVYNFSPNEDRDHALECAICLCVFEDEEIGRKLPACGHAFHVECIDMWLHSHSNCPICRAGVQCNHINKIDRSENEIAEISDPGRNSIGQTINNDEDLCLEIVTIGNHVGEFRETADVASSSLIVESQSSNKLLNISSSSSSGSRSGGKVYPSSVVNVDES